MSTSDIHGTLPPGPVYTMRMTPDGKVIGTTRGFPILRGAGQILTDGHPDPLVVPVEYEYSQPGWPYLTAYLHHHEEYPNQPHRFLVMVTRVALSVTVMGDTFQDTRLMMTYQHPSEEYLREVARQLTAGERSGFFFGDPTYIPTRVHEVYLWRHHERTTPTELRPLDHFPCARCPQISQGDTVSVDASTPT